eukprot:gnl/MRDRNA2_/MRDRNA2_235621_c0_seq1.p2 gnl/MRDRNA2_/MRDRNA2_235621_c0~~gnl/MRDRNA2_/MRDRNA2_235621_c0_seq1.p2  ORF type:complete len:100 (-),score=18.27 gnl/MRDRNA2_/MRDRNA2_235621_c0_seq1:243-542(-)
MLLSVMCTEMLEANETSYNALITNCEKAKHWELALQLFYECNVWMKPDIVCYSAVISACEKGREWQQALLLLKIMCQERTWPNTTTFAAVISACEKGIQ